MDLGTSEACKSNSCSLPSKVSQGFLQDGFVYMEICLGPKIPPIDGDFALRFIIMHPTCTRYVNVFAVSPYLAHPHPSPTDNIDKGEPEDGRR